MPQKCVVGDCSYVRSSENGIVLHMIPFYSNESPEAKKRRKRLIDFLRRKHAGWDPSKSLVICSKDFKKDDFVRNYALITDKQAQSLPYLVRDSFGFTAYPTVHAGELEDEQPLSNQDKRMVRCFTSTKFLSSSFRNEMFIIPCLVKP